MPKSFNFCRTPKIIFGERAINQLADLAAAYGKSMLVITWLDRFAFRIELGAWFFIGAGLTALIIAWVTVGSQAIRAARVNPADCLRDE